MTTQVEQVELTLNQRALILVTERLIELENLLVRMEALAKTSKSPSLHDCSPSSLRRINGMIELNKGVYEWLSGLEGNEVH